MNSWHLPNTYHFEGRPVRYTSLGKGDPLVLVHGTPWSSYNLRHLARRLAERFKVYAYDLIGYGQSSMDPGEVSLGIQNQLLSELIDYWQLESPIGIGHDFGGATVLRSLLLNQQTFRKIVLIDPVAVSPWGSPFFLHVRKHEAAFAGAPDYIHEAIVRAYINTAAHTELSSEMISRTVDYWCGDAGKPAFYRQIAQADSKYTEEVQALYPSIDIPTLLLWGREDSWIPIEQGRQLHAMMPASQFQEIEDAGHLVIEEKPKELLQHIMPFLTEN